MGTVATAEVDGSTAQVARQNFERVGVAGGIELVIRAATVVADFADQARSLGVMPRRGRPPVTWDQGPNRSDRSVAMSVKGSSNVARQARIQLRLGQR